MHSLTNIQSLLNYGENQLKKHGIENYKKETEWLLLDVINKDLSWLLVNKEYNPTPQEIRIFIDHIEYRSNHIPFQLITGKATFYGRDFKIWPDVFIPRPDTEIIVDVLKKKNFSSVLDIGVGSAALSISLILEINNIHIDAIDNSITAIDNSLANISHYNCDKNIDIYKMDILNEIPKKRYDVIISNPPYIPMNNISSLDLSVRVYDPLDALTDYGDGMKFYKRFFEISNSILNKNGIIIFEFGDVIQKNRIIDIFHNFKYEIYNDATNQPRVIVLQ